MHNPYLKVGLFLLGNAIGVGLHVIMMPIRAINDEIAKQLVEWPKSREYQSITDKFQSGRIDHKEWLEAMHSRPAAMLWAKLSTSHPNQIPYINKRIKEVYPHAVSWS